jgi:hypothetical protein
MFSCAPLFLRIAVSLPPPHAALLIAATALSAMSARAQPIVVATEAERYQYELCSLIEDAAEDNDLPVGFFTRLIWKESRFRSDAVSPKGAQGIAQFMPGTAEQRGLADPFDPVAAIPASAHLLADLGRRFGNLGLAAAAYNAGAERVRGWLANGGSLPYETQDYVLSITGVPAESWAGEDAPKDAEPASESDCLVLAAKLDGPGADISPQVETAEAPWGVQVAGNFSRAKAIAAYAALQKRFPALLADRPPMVISGRMQGRGTRTFYRVRVPAETRAEGEAFCAELNAAGGSCIVLKS